MAAAATRRHIHGFPHYAAAEQGLCTSLSETPEYLPAYVDLYKLYFYSKRLDEAERVVRAALAEAARQGGFEADWQQLDAGSFAADADSPGRIYLYSLKALAFIRMRQLAFDEADAVLSHLKRLDPEDRVGASVIDDVAAGLRGSMAEGDDDG